MATNRKYATTRTLRLGVASPTVSGDPVVVGGVVGVALTDYSADDAMATVDLGGAYDLSVKGVNGAGNVAVSVGDPLYFVSGDTPVLSKKATGSFFGYALEAIDSGATATIGVLIMQGGRGTGEGTAGMFLSAETTGTGSAQNVAHGLGRAPANVAVMLTEFASGLNIDIAEGTHTTTNVVLTVTSGAKFKVMAW